MYIFEEYYRIFLENKLLTIYPILCSFQVTYCEYFKIQYNINIKDVTQPLLVSRIKPRKVCHPSISSEAVRVICLIPELCHVTGLTSEQRANRDLVTEISSITRLNPRLKAGAMGQLLKEITGI